MIGRVRERERQFLPAALVPKWPQQWELSWSKARSFIWISHMGKGAQGLGLAAAFPGTLSGHQVIRGAARTQTSVADGGLTHLQVR